MSTSREQLLDASQRVRAFHERQQAEYIIEDHDDPDQKQLTEDSLLVVNGIRELLAEHQQLLNACKAAMRIAALWQPPDGEISPEHLGEMQALSAMKDKFEVAIRTAERRS